MSNPQANGDSMRVAESLEKLVAVLPITQIEMASCARKLTPKGLGIV